MITRIVEPNEAWKGGLVRSVAFEGSVDLAAEREKCASMTPEEIAAAKQPPAPEGPPLLSDRFRSADEWGTFADDNETLFGSILVNNYTANFDGHPVLMGGIGGVATLPQHRRGGVIRRCFEKALPDMYEKGFLLSALYPFSQSYYRQFGYEVGAEVRTWTVELDAIPLLPPRGSIVQLFPGDDFSPLLDIYQKFYEKYNLSVFRKVYDRALLKDNLLAQQRYVYLWRSETGEPRGFFLSKKTDDRVFNCTTNFWLPNAFLALDAEAYAAMFSFIRRTFAADYRTLRLDTPGCVDLRSFFAEHNKVECSLRYNGMLRVVNVEAALRLCRTAGSGRVKIAVDDPQLAQNTGTWLLEFSGGENRVSRTEEAPDISMPVSAFGPLICGCRGAEELPLIPAVQVLNGDAPLASVFYRKPCHILNLF